MRRWLICVWLFSAALWAQQPSSSFLGAASLEISGTVIDSVGKQPVAGARVAIAPVSQRDAFTTVVTGDDGRFVFSHLTAGKYTLTAQRRGYVTQSFNQHGTLATSIAVGPALDSTHLIFAIFHESAISGAVTDESGDAVRNAQIILFQTTTDSGIRQTRQRSTTATNDEGRYHFAHLRTGKYFVAVSAQPWYAIHPQTRVKVVEANGSTTTMSGGLFQDRPDAKSVVFEEGQSSPLDVAYPITFYGGLDPGSATPITLEKGERASADIELQPVRAAHTQLSFPPSDQPMQVYGTVEQKLFDGALIQLPAHANQIRPGVMEIGGLAPGHYSVNVRTINSQSAEKHELNVGESGIIEKTADGTPAPLMARVNVESSADLGQLFLQLRDRISSEVLREPIAEKGDVEFKQGIQPGSYEVSVQGGRDLYIRSIQATGARATGRSLEVSGSSAVKLTVALSSGRGDVSGVVLRGDKPVAGVLVVLVPADPGNNQVLFRRDQSDSDGTFSLPAVVPGKYTLLAIEGGWEMEWANPAVLQKFMALGEVLTVESKGKYSLKVKVQ